MAASVWMMARKTRSPELDCDAVLLERYRLFNLRDVEGVITGRRGHLALKVNALANGWVGGEHEVILMSLVAILDRTSF